MVHALHDGQPPNQKVPRHIDEIEARRRANEIWHEQNYRLKHGLSIVEHAFNEVAEEFIKKIEDEAERKERSTDHAYFWPPKVRRFLIGYFREKPQQERTAGAFQALHGSQRLRSLQLHRFRSRWIRCNLIGFRNNDPCFIAMIARRRNAAAVRINRRGTIRAAPRRCVRT
ncbi:hypothetical protein ACQKGL_19640 [Ensifer adhaerens]|uniref:hypothetical protein n=1 Tax=Ensifer adhaerens TaxID=106592 RepID=UPI003D0357F5